jgi:hypothetical protein
MAENGTDAQVAEERQGARAASYATSHDELDADQAIQDEVRNAARALLEGIEAQRSGRLLAAGEDLAPPRQK